MSSAVVVFSLNAFAAFRLKSLICRLTIRHPAPLAARATLPLQGRVIDRYALGIRRLCAHLTRKLSLAIHHRVRFNHIRHHLWTPTPDPSPPGGREKRRSPCVALKRTSPACCASRRIAAPLSYVCRCRRTLFWFPAR